MIKGVALVHVFHAFTLPTGIWSLMRPDDQLQLVRFQKCLSIHDNHQSAWTAQIADRQILGAAIANGFRHSTYSLEYIGQIQGNLQVAGW